MTIEGDVPDPNRLITGAATGSLTLSSDHLESVLQWVAQVGFDPDAQEHAGGRLAGIEWRSQILRSSDRLPPAVAHYLRHVVAVSEWPVGTTLDGYLASIARVVTDPAASVFTSRYQGRWQLGIVAPSGNLRGPQGGEMVLIEYRVATGHWMTAFQPQTGLLVLDDPRREDLRWLRRRR